MCTNPAGYSWIWDGLTDINHTGWGSMQCIKEIWRITECHLWGVRNPGFHPRDNPNSTQTGGHTYPQYKNVHQPCRLQLDLGRTHRYQLHRMGLHAVHQGDLEND
ncbi:hypothetical protein AAFF_G00393910 [Aldrovandia affinis]|uniref:Uncharacterized protein n=1 Tax=Aldrovandia affinis TaxID=143900 RepID=A0AAD7SDN8_9TELE|nr:hypothetical protein AAFF_G00393910 [Aldrovandia affinis]